MNTEFWAALFVAASLVWVWRFYLWQKRAIRKRADPAEPEHYPSLSIIRPIKGLDAGMEDNLRAALEHGYPGEVETLFVFDDESEPALPLVEQAIARKRETGQTVDARIIFSGQPSANRTGKLNSMIVALNESKNELIVFVDSDVRQDLEALRVMVATLLADDKAGAAFAPVIAGEPPTTVGDAGCTLMINALYEPAALASADGRGGELPFIMGHIMVFRREAIEAIGGLETAEGQLVDDMYLGLRLNECGYRNKISPHPVAIVQQGTTNREFIRILIRWIAFSISGLPTLSFKFQHWLTGVAFWSGSIIALAAALSGHPLLAAFAALAPLSVAAMINDLNCRMTGTPLPLKYLWVSSVLWLAAPLIYARILTTHEVNWRGRRYQLNTRSRLDQPDGGKIPHA